MDLDNLVMRFYTIKDSFFVVDTRFRALDRSTDSLMKEVVDVAYNIMTLASALERRKIVVKISNDDYAEITSNNIMFCHKFACYKPPVHLAALELIKILLKDRSDFIFSKELGELHEIYNNVANIRLQTHTINMNCTVYVRSPHKKGVLERIEASVYGANIVVTDENGKTRDTGNIDDYIVISIAYNCYEDFMKAMSSLIEKHKTLYSLIKTYKEKIDEYKTFINLYKKMDDH